MSIKSIIQILILLLIIIILGSVYFQYFSKEKTVIEETAKTNLESEKLYQELEKKIIELEKKNDKLKEEIEIKIDQLDKKKEDEKLEAKKKLFEAIVDDNEFKQNLYTPGKKIPIISYKKLIKKNFDVILIFAWNFSSSIISRLRKDFKNSQKKLIVPFPKVKVIKC